MSEIIKAGSLGHGTAVRGHYDLDMVIYSDSKVISYLKDYMNH